MMSCGHHTDQTDNDINSQLTDQSILEIAATAIAAGFIGGEREARRGRLYLII